MKFNAKDLDLENDMTDEEEGQNTESVIFL